MGVAFCLSGVVIVPRFTEIYAFLSFGFSRLKKQSKCQHKLEN